MKQLFLITLILIFCSKIYAKVDHTILLITDESQNLDYSSNGKIFLFKRDLKELIKQDIDYNSKLVILRITKLSEEQKVSGELIEKFEDQVNKIKFDAHKSLWSIYKDHIKGKVELILHGHTFSNELLNTILPTQSYKFNTISSSACKMASIERLSILFKYSDYVLASPENVHLAHFDFKNLFHSFNGNAANSLRELQLKSFDRLLKYTKSNLVLNIYKKDKLNNLTCTEQDLMELLLYQEINLSKFENKSINNNQFILNDCKTTTKEF